MPENKLTQLAFDLSASGSTLREDLIESPANATAIAMVDAWPEWPGAFTVLAGPIGSGKSHIASVWMKMSNAVSVDAHAISADEPNLLRQAAAGRPVLIENMGSQPVDETAVFHLLNLIRENAGFGLITSRFWPKEWELQLPDLRSRLMAAQLVELQEPDDLLLKQVMAKLFSDRQLQIDASVIEYCALRMERSLETAARLVEAMDTIALSEKSVISRKTAAKALVELGMA